MDDNRDYELPLRPIPDEENAYYGDSEDGEAAAVDFQAVMAEVLGHDNPFTNDSDDEEKTSDETEDLVENFEHKPSKTVKAVKHLAKTGLPLSKLLDDMLLGDQNIRSNC